MCGPIAVCCVGGPPALDRACSSMRLKDGAEGGEPEAVGGGGRVDGTGTDTLVQVIPPREKRETVRDSPPLSTCKMSEGNEVGGL